MSVILNITTKLLHYFNKLMYIHGNHEGKKLF